MFSLLHSNPDISVGPLYLVEGRDEENYQGVNHHFSSLVYGITLLSAAVVRNQLGSLPIPGHSFLSKLWATS